MAWSDTDEGAYGGYGEFGGGYAGSPAGGGWGGGLWGGNDSEDALNK